MNFMTVIVSSIPGVGSADLVATLKFKAIKNTEFQRLFIRIEITNLKTYLFKSSCPILRMPVCLYALLMWGMSGWPERNGCCNCMRLPTTATLLPMPPRLASFSLLFSELSTKIQKKNFFFKIWNLKSLSWIVCWFFSECTKVFWNIMRDNRDQFINFLCKTIRNVQCARLNFCAC